MSGSTSKRYPVELRERAVRMVSEIRVEHESEWAAMTQVARLLGIGTPETVRKWCRQVEVDAGRRPGVTSEAESSAYTAPQQQYSAAAEMELREMLALCGHATQPHRCGRPTLS